MPPGKNRGELLLQGSIVNFSMTLHFGFTHDIVTLGLYLCKCWCVCFCVCLFLCVCAFVCLFVSVCVCECVCESIHSSSMQTAFYKQQRSELSIES